MLFTVSEISVKSMNATLSASTDVVMKTSAYANCGHSLPTWMKCTKSFYPINVSDIIYIPDNQEEAFATLLTRCENPHVKVHWRSRLIQALVKIHTLTPPAISGPFQSCAQFLRPYSHSQRPLEGGNTVWMEWGSPTNFSADQATHCSQCRSEVLHDLTREVSLKVEASLKGLGAALVVQDNGLLAKLWPLQKPTTATLRGSALLLCIISILPLW